MTEGTGPAPPTLTIVIPAYNEESRLPRSLRRLQASVRALPFDVEVVVVDDGSLDGTAAVVELAGAGWPQLSLLRLPHRGKGSAVRAGMLASSGRCCFLADADLSMPLEYLPRFLELIERGADVVVGSREGDGAVRRGEPATRHLMGRLFNLVARALGLTDLPDTQCGFKAFSGPAARRLFAQQTLDHFAFDVEILFLARRQGYRIDVLPIEWHYDSNSRVSPIGDSLRMLMDMCLVRARLLRRTHSPAAAPVDGDVHVPEQPALGSSPAAQP